MKKRLSVFISSTYQDLRSERDAALRAVLEAGHIPAGMELFAAGSSSQLETIERWIDKCDAYMLILGGRYGSLEPNSGTGYVELEYDYAAKQGKRVFALVLNEAALHQKSLTLGKDATDEHGIKLKQFRERVLTKIAALIEDTKDLRAETLKSLAEISENDDVLGWISGEDARAIMRERDALQGEIAQLRRAAAAGNVNIGPAGLVKLIEGEPVPGYGENLLDLLRAHGNRLMVGVSRGSRDPVDATLIGQCPTLMLFGLVQEQGEDWGQDYVLTEAGRAMVIMAKARALGVALL